jgi:hypothetical protein
MNIISFIFAVTPSSEMPKPTAVSVFLMAFILVSTSAYFKQIVIVILRFVYACKWSVGLSGGLTVMNFHMSL